MTCQLNGTERLYVKMMEAKASTCSKSVQLKLPLLAPVTSFMSHPVSLHIKKVGGIFTKIPVH